MPVSSFAQLFAHVLADLYSVETQIIKALPKMVEASSDKKLSGALQEHLKVSKKQLDRLDTIRQKINFKTNVMCDGIKGIITEGEKMLAEISDSPTKNAAIIAAAQKVEHYEIATYGTAEEYAKQLEFDDAAELLHETLEEEKKADADLSKLAEGGFFRKGLNEEAIKK